MNKRFVLVLTVLVLGFFGFLFFTKKDSKTNDSQSSGQLSEHTVGEGKTGVVLVEYGDFECPACYRFFPVLQQVKEKYKEEITFQFRHYPLVEIHQNALLSARAAEAASIQGKFWEMHDLLYQNQSQWSKMTDPTPAFEAFASQLKLDVEKFKVDLKSEAVNDIIQADLAHAKGLGLSSTPSFILDGQVLEDPRDTLEYFSEQIDKAIADKQQAN